MRETVWVFDKCKSGHFDVFWGSEESEYFEEVRGGNENEIENEIENDHDSYRDEYENGGWERFNWR